MSDLQGHIRDLVNPVISELERAFRKQVIQGAVAGFPAWYKDRLLKRAFEK